MSDESVDGKREEGEVGDAVEIAGKEEGEDESEDSTESVKGEGEGSVERGKEAGFGEGQPAGESGGEAEKSEEGSSESEEETTPSSTSKPDALSERREGEEGGETEEGDSSLRSQEPPSPVESEVRNVANAERLCATRHQFYPASSVEMQDSYQKLVTTLNESGVRLLRSSDPLQGFRFFNCAEAITRHLTEKEREKGSDYASKLQRDDDVEEDDLDKKEKRDAQGKGGEEEEEEGADSSLFIPGPITGLLLGVDPTGSTSRHAVHGLLPPPAAFTNSPLRCALRAKTLSNIGCYLVRVGRTKEALHYFLRGLALETKVMQRLEMEIGRLHQRKVALHAEASKSENSEEKSSNPAESASEVASNEGEDRVKNMRQSETTKVEEALTLAVTKLRLSKISIASSHLNVCAALSALVKHGRALAHAQLALSLLLKVHPSPPKECLKFLVEGEVKLALSGIPADESAEEEKGKERLERVEEGEGESEQGEVEGNGDESSRKEEKEGGEKGEEGTPYIGGVSRSAQAINKSLADLLLLYNDADSSEGEGEIGELLILALFNIGAELEYINEQQYALTAFHEAYQQSLHLPSLTRISRQTLKSAYTDLDMKLMKRKEKQQTAGSYPSFLSIPPDKVEAVSIAKTIRMRQSGGISDDTNSGMGRSRPSAHALAKKSGGMRVKQKPFVEIPPHMTRPARRGLTRKHPYVLREEVTEAGKEEASGRDDGYISILSGYQAPPPPYGAPYGERHPRKAMWRPDNFQRDFKQLLQNPTYAERIARQEIRKQKNTHMAATAPPPDTDSQVTMVDPQVMPKAAEENALVERLKASIGEAEYEGERRRKHRLAMFKEDPQQGDFHFPPIEDKRRRDRRSAFGPSQYLLVDQKSSVLPEAFGYRYLRDAYERGEEERARVDRLEVDMSTSVRSMSSSLLRSDVSDRNQARLPRSLPSTGFATTSNAEGGKSGGIDGLTAKVQKALETSFRGDIVDLEMEGHAHTLSALAQPLPPPGQTGTASRTRSSAQLRSSANTGKHVTIGGHRPPPSSYPRDAPARPVRRHAK